MPAGLGWLEWQGQWTSAAVELTLQVCIITRSLAIARLLDVKGPSLSATMLSDNGKFGHWAMIRKAHVSGMRLL